MSKEDQFNWVYILQMKNGNFYTGYTVDIVKRYNAHLKGTKAAAKFTRIFKTEKLLAAWKVFGPRGNALRVEAFIKKKSRLQKEELLDKPKSLQKDFNGQLGVKFRIRFVKMKL